MQEARREESRQEDREEEDREVTRSHLPEGGVCPPLTYRQCVPPPTVKKSDEAGSRRLEARTQNAGFRIALASVLSPLASDLDWMPA